MYFGFYQISLMPQEKMLLQQRSVMVDITTAPIEELAWMNLFEPR